MTTRRSHMDCFSSPYNCWLGDDETCPMKPVTHADFCDGTCVENPDAVVCPKTVPPAMRAQPDPHKGPYFWPSRLSLELSLNSALQELGVENASALAHALGGLLPTAEDEEPR